MIHEFTAKEIFTLHSSLDELIRLRAEGEDPRAFLVLEDDEVVFKVKGRKPMRLLMIK